MDKTEYDELYSCNKCGGENIVTELDSVWYSGVDVLSEANTVCKDCRFSDYWAHGAFQSRLDGYNECAKYTT